MTLSDSLKTDFRRSVLSNGVRVVTERHPAARAAAVAFFVDVGTRDESVRMSGAAHFVEHMVFKGTLTRDAYEIAKSLEAVGGDLNAYTSREETCYHATCLADHLPLAIDVLCDLVSNAEFEMIDFRREREVINQEISMSSDDAEDYIYDLYYASAFRGHEMARPILGTTKTLGSITRKKLIGFYHGHYHGKQLVVSVAGQIDHDKVCEQLERSLRLRKRKALPRVRRRPRIKPFIKVENREGDQCHMLVGSPCSGLRDRDRFDAYIVNAALGGGMTSRLYQKIREQMGLSYSVYSSLHSLSDHGLLTVYLATAKKNLKDALHVVFKEFKHLYRFGLSQSDINYYRTQVIGEILLDSDDLDNRAQGIGGQELIYDKPRSVDDIVKDIEKVSVESVRAFTKKFFDSSKLGVVVFGDVPQERTANWIKKTLGRT